MARHNRTYVVGSFVAGTTAILIIGLLWLAGSHFFRPIDSYTILFNDSVSGLLPGAAVEFNGVNVGKVDAIHLTKDSPPKVAVDIEVHPGTPIRRDSIASLTGSLVTGIRFIQIRGGTDQRGLLAPGEPIGSDEKGGFNDIARQATELTVESRQLVTKLNEDILSPENRRHLDAILADTAVSSGNVKTITNNLASPRNLTAIHSTLEDIARAANQLNSTLVLLSGRTDALSSKLLVVLDHMDQTVEAAQMMVGRADGVIDNASDHIQNTLRRLDHVTERLDDTLENIQYDPSVILWGTKVRQRENVK